MEDTWAIVDIAHIPMSCHYAGVEECLGVTNIKYKVIHAVIKMKRKHDSISEEFASLKNFFVN